MVSIVSAPQITINELGVFSSGDFHFQVQASRYADAGTEITMELLLTDSSGVVKTLLFNLPIGTVPVAVVNLSVAQVSALAMTVALDSLGVAYHLTGECPADLNRYASIFMILGTGNSGTHLLTDVEGGALAAYLRQGGNLYLESYNTWYYNPATMLHPMLHYTSQKVHAYFYAELKGMPATFTDSMSYVYTSPVNYAVFSLEPQAPAYSTLDNEDTPARSLEFAYDGSDYKTIGTMCEFSALSGAAAPSSQKTLMQRYLEFFDLNIHGPWPLFHAQDTWACRAQQVTFTDDSFDNIVSRTWEFEGGMPATSNLANPVVTYNTTGKYDVKLTVSDGTRTRTILKSKYIQVDYCSGEPESEAAASLFRIFPNPATGKVSVEINRDIHGMCTLTLYDLTGRILNVLELMQDGQNGRFMLDLSGIRKGMYFIRLQADNKAVTQKLMVN
jgi:hypothetical protein